MKANYHTHAPGCLTADKMRPYAEAAIECGLKILGFSEHSPQLFPNGHDSLFRLYPNQMDSYVTAVLDLRREYENDIDIRLGLEVEYYPEIFGALDEFLAQYPIEYYILGQHYLDNEYDTGISSGWHAHSDEMLVQYTSQVLEALGTGKFTYLAHPDLFTYSGDEALYESEVVRLCDGARALGVPLEINLLGLNEDRHYPSDRFFGIAAGTGCKFVLGCDAHAPESIFPEGFDVRLYDFLARHNITPLENITLRPVR